MECIGLPRIQEYNWQLYIQKDENEIRLRLLIDVQVVLAGIMAHLFHPL